MNLSGTPPKKLPDPEIEQEGSTMERFASLTLRLLGVSRENVKKAEEQLKAERTANRLGGREK